jgi:hypothetical protein
LQHQGVLYIWRGLLVPIYWRHGLVICSSAPNLIVISVCESVQSSLNIGVRTVVMHPGGGGAQFTCMWRRRLDVGRVLRICPAALYTLPDPSSLPLQRAACSALRDSASPIRHCVLICPRANLPVTCPVVPLSPSPCDGRADDCDLFTDHVNALQLGPALDVL